MKNKLLLLSGLVVIALFLAISYLAFYAPKKTTLILMTDNQIQEEIKSVGGNQDEYGCFTSAGYSWCEMKKKCLRVWEEPCDFIPSVPKNYTLDKYQITKTLDVACTNNADCITPGEYLVQSSCPYTSLCLESKCNVVCPSQIVEQAAAQPEKVDYLNKDYGFSISLPASWAKFSIVNDKWEGNMVSGKPGKISGPKILVRHPLWTAKVPRQDIPVMIFTPSQWDLIQQESLAVSAAPIGPSELGRNANYIFALPARYNYAFPIGFEEVEQIIKDKSFQVF